MLKTTYFSPLLPQAAQLMLVFVFMSEWDNTKQFLTSIFSVFFQPPSSIHQKSCTLLGMKILFVLSNCNVFHEYSSKSKGFWLKYTPPNITPDSFCQIATVFHEYFFYSVYSSKKCFCKGSFNLEICLLSNYDHDKFGHSGCRALSSLPRRHMTCLNHTRYRVFSSVSINRSLMLVQLF